MGAARIRYRPAMDQLGEDAAERRVADLITADALAVAALAFVMASVLATGLFQFLAFAVFPEQGPQWQYVLAASPVLVFSLGGCLAARAAWRRGVSDGTFTALAGAGLLVGGVIALVMAAGIVLTIVRDPQLL